jgi:hypothetical protein
LLSAVTVALQATQELLQRLQQPTSATIAAEYANINKLDAFHRTKNPAPGRRPATLPLPQQQYATIMWQWCEVAKPLLRLLTDPASAENHDAVLGAGKLLSTLGNCLECWLGTQAVMVAQMVLQQQIAQHTSGTVLDWRWGCVHLIMCAHAEGWGGVRAAS